MEGGEKRTQRSSGVTLPYALETGTREIRSLGIEGDCLLRPLDKVLERADSVRRAGSDWLVRCPLPNHGQGRGDRNPSVSVSEGDDRRALVSCKAGCETEAVVAAWGLSMSDLFESRNGLAGGNAARPGTNGKEMCGHTPRDGTATLQRCTLQGYAEAKRLPVEYLETLGLRDAKYQGSQAVRIPYHSPDGSETAVRFRLALEKSVGGDLRFKWRGGSKTALYGLERLEEARKAGYVLLVEGESDAQTLWHHGIPALGIPGADTWKPRWAEHLEGVERVYVVVEPDGGGEALKGKLSATSDLSKRLHLVRLGEHEDASGLHVADPERFEERFGAALEEATPLREELHRERKEEARKAWAACEELAGDTDILARFATELARSGVAGESRVAKLLYLAVTSRLLQRPASIAMKGPSSGGKSYLTEQVLSFFPDSAYYALTAMSERALAYSDEPLVHRFLVIYEAAGMESEFQTYLIRSLLSEGRVRYETVEKTSEGMKPRLIERAGPTGLIVTTTRTRLHPENETRLISLTVTDTRDQTRDIMAALASDTEGERPDMESWHALQSWLEGAERRVAIPYAKKLAGSIPPVAVRLRRDFGALLTLIRAHALLHQVNRERDGEGRIVATTGDYGAVRELVAELISEGIEATVPATVRETVEKVTELCSEDSEAVTVAELARALKLDKSATSRRVGSAADRGYLKNLEERKGRPARLVPGDPLPDDIEILPEPDALAGDPGANGDRCSVAADREGVHTDTPSGPVRPATEEPAA